MNFALAIRQLNEGHMIRRQAWPLGCFIGLTIGHVHGVQKAFLVAKAPDGSKRPWIANPEDVTVEDWKVFDPATDQDSESERLKRIARIPEDEVAYV